MRCPACERENPADAVCAGIVLVEAGRPRGWAFCGYQTRAQVLLLRAEGPSARAEVGAAIARLQALVDASGARLLEGHIHLVRAELTAVLSDAATQRRALAEAHRRFTPPATAPGWPRSSGAET